MEKIETLIREYLQTARMVQIATVAGGQPWSCTLYFVADAECNLYWISKPETRHSQEIHQHAQVAASIPVKFDDLEVIGLQLEGNAAVVENPETIRSAARLYADKFARGEEWYQQYIAGKVPYKLYCIKPTYFVLFDRINFPEQERQEWKVNIKSEV